MHVTPDSPVTDRAAVMLANAVMYAGQAPPHPDAAPDEFELHTGPWTPDPAQWRRVCHLVHTIVSEDAVAVLVGIVDRAAERDGNAALSQLLLLDYWHQTDPTHRTGALVRLAWAARHGAPVTDEDHDEDVPAVRRVEAARRLQDAAHAHEAAGGDDASWFGGRFPVLLPTHPGTAEARTLVDATDEAGETVASLHVALLLSAATVTAGGTS